MQEQLPLEKPAAEKSPYFELYDWMDCIVYSVLVVVLLLSFRLIGVDGTSMVPTLQDGDRVLLQSIFYKPQAGDIVVFTKLQSPLVKRIIATEGQIVDIDFAQGIVYVDNVPLDEPYINELTFTDEGTEFPLTLGDVSFPVEVPQGCVFVLGDNRNHSSDSRVSQVGMVDTRHILGKISFRLLPFSSFGKIAYS